MCKKHLYTGKYGSEEKKFEVFAVVKMYGGLPGYDAMYSSSSSAILAVHSSNFLVHDSDSGMASWSHE
jgi:hypothetical protein